MDACSRLARSCLASYTLVDLEENARECCLTQSFREVDVAWTVGKLRVARASQFIRRAAVQNYSCSGVLLNGKDVQLNLVLYLRRIGEADSHFNSAGLSIRQGSSPSISLGPLMHPGGNDVSGLDDGLRKIPEVCDLQDWKDRLDGQNS